MITEKFSPKEQKKMKEMLKRYGAIQDCANKTGVHRSTVTRAIKLGEASLPVAIKMRIYLSGFSSKLYMEAA
jgi:DNA invertase Pin-like site-specific DNA recombinase